MATRAAPPPHEATLLAGLARAVDASLDFPALVARALEGARALCSADLARLALREPGADAMRVVCSVGAREPHADLPLLPGPAVRDLVAADGRAYQTDGWLDDPRVNPAVFPDAEREGVVALLVAPIVVDGEVEGLLGLANRGPARFRARDEGRLGRITALVAMAIRHERLLQRSRGEQERLRSLIGLERASRRQMEALLEIERELVAELDPDALFELIVTRARGLFEADCGIQLVTDGGQLVPRADTDPTMMSLTVSIAEGVSGAAVRAGRGALVNDYPRSPQAVAWAVARGVQHLMVQPLRIRDRAFGLMAMSRRGAAAPPFAAEDLAAMERFAALAALALDNARIHEEAGRRRREAEVLAQLAGDISGSLDPDTVLERVVDGACELCGSDLAGIALRDAASGEMHLRYTPGARQHWTGYAIRPGAGTGGEVLRTGRPFKTDDYQTDLRIGREHVDGAASEGIVAQAVVPIQRDQHLEGLLYASNRSARPFTDRDLEVLQRLADHAAIAIHNARLFTEREQSSAALRQSERRYRLLAEHMADVVTVFDMDLQQVYVSPSVLRLRGFTPEEVLRQSLIERMTPTSLERARLALAEELAIEAAGGGDPKRSRTLELEMPRKDGSTVWVEASTTFLRDDAGRAVAIIAVARDVGARKRAEGALRESEVRLRQAQKMEAVGRLAGGIAHDFSNLLTVIGGRAELLLGTSAMGGPRRHDLELIRAIVERGGLLTRQLLAFSRKQVLQPAVLDLDRVVRSMGQLLRRLIGEDIDLHLSECPEPLRVYADPSQVEQVVMNLAVNARDAMPRGGRLSIELSRGEVDAAWAGAHPEARPGSYVTLTVSDTGVGMDAETRAHLFEPFFTTKQVGEGTGLGLATVYGIVQQSGGHIEVDSELGRGATFRVYLPCVGEVPVESSADPPAVASIRGTGTILVVEDETELRLLVREILEMQGYRVLAAREAEEARGAAQRYGESIDLLLTDVVLPGERGDDLGRAMVESGQVRVVLYMSGYPDTAVLSTAAFLQKPFSATDLVRKVRESLDTPA